MRASLINITLFIYSILRIEETRHRMKFSYKKYLIFSLLLAGTFEHASAATFFYCNGNLIKRHNTNVLYRFEQMGFPAGSVWRTPATSAVRKANQNPSVMRGTVQWNENGVGLNNSENEIWWTHAITAPADAPQHWNCATGVLISSDIRLSNSESHNWTPYGTTKADSLAYGGGSRPLENTLLHELGHAMGLDHTTDTQSIMGTDWTFVHANGATQRPYLGPDASNALAVLYGSTHFSDLSVSHWRHTGSAYGYATHGRTRVFDLEGNVLFSYESAGEPIYHVDRGQTVQVEFTYENNGDTARVFDIDFLLSTDNVINRADRNIGGRTDISLPAAYTWTKAFPVTIPADLTSGVVYYLGVKIDSTNKHAEVTEANNWTYVGISIN